MKLRTVKRFCLEFTGSLGDVGTFIPIAYGLIRINKVNGASLFLAAGLLYILAGLYFRVPIPVQPLKATSIMAMAIGASAATIAHVSFFIVTSLFIITLLNLDKLLGRIFSRPIIRGIQLGLGLILLKSGFRLIFVSSGHLDSFVMDESLNLYQSFFLLFLPQLPLTLANSIYATCDTAQNYFHEKAARVNPRALIISLGLGNLLSGYLGGIPLCHGSSGLTAHYRFGARSGLCGLGVGSLFFLLALAFATGADKIVTLIPFWCLGLSLLYVGIRHGLLINDLILFPRELAVALIIGLYTLIFGNLAVAFLIGIIVNFIIDNSLGYLNERKV